MNTGTLVGAGGVGLAGARRRALAASDVTVLIGGETGVGKGLLARELHAESPRREGPFVVADCSALTPTLFESLLFGHVKGAFTGASSERLGLARAADGGTLFLDEVGELSAELQAKLLSLIEDRAVLPVGAERRVDVDVRIIAATHRDLRAMVDEGEFREDLFYRLAVVEIRVAPLRDRRDMIPELVEEMVARKAAMLRTPERRPTRAFVDALMAYDWPGNIRELGNCVERALVLSAGDRLEVGALPGRMLDALRLGEATPEARRAAARAALGAAGGCKAEAARRLGVSRRHLYRLLEPAPSGR